MGYGKRQGDVTFEFYQVRVGALKMSDEKSGGKNNQESGGQLSRKPDGSQIQPMQLPPWGWYQPPDDEIDLADLAGLLFRRKWLIVGLTLVFACLAFAASMMMTEKYAAVTMLEIGQLLGENGYTRVESTDAVKNRISSLARAVAGEMAEAGGKSAREAPAENGLGFSVKKDLQVDAPREGNIISCELEAPRDSKALALLSRVNEALLRDHNRIFEQRRGELENAIARKELEIKSLDIKIGEMKNKIGELKRKYEEKTGEKKNAIRALASKIENIQSQKDFAKEKIALLQQEKEDLKQRIKEAEARYDRLLHSKLEAFEQARGAGAVGLMLFNSEVQHIQDYLSQLRERLLFKIPENISELQTLLKELDTRISNARAEKELEEMRLAQLGPELKDKIEEIRGQIERLEGEKEEKRISINEFRNRLENMIVTQVIVQPGFSEDPVSPNLKLNVALGLVLGFFVSVFAAFIIEFWENNKEKIRGRQAGGNEGS